MTTIPRGQVWYTLLVTIAASILVGAASVTISLRSLHASNRKLCDVVVAQDDAYSTTPPTTPAGRRIASSMHKLRGDLDC